MIQVTYLSDPGCPWAYSALPSISTLRWRYGDQLDWRVVTIGLTESGSQYEQRGYTPGRAAMAGIRFARFGMPFAFSPRSRVVGTGRACRAIVAARLEDPELAYPALRALHLAWFTTDLLLDEDEAIAAALAREPALDAGAIVARIDDAEVEEAYQSDRATARGAAGSAASLQDRTAATDGPERYTAPTLIFETDGTRLVAGGHQSLVAYDVIVANLGPGLRCERCPDSPLPLLERFRHGLTTREVALLLAGRNDDPDDAAATAALLELAERGLAVREPHGNDGLWLSAEAAEERRVAARGFAESRPV